MLSGAEVLSVTAVEWLASDKQSRCFQVPRRWTENSGNSLMPGSCRLSRLCPRNQAECRLPLAKVLSSNACLDSDCRQGNNHVVATLVTCCISCISNSSNKDSHQSSRER